MTSKILRIIKISIGITIILLAISMSYQFIKYSFTEDYRYNVKSNFEDIDGKMEFTNYDVQGQETTELFDLEDSEVKNLRLIGLCLSSLSIVYVLLTLIVKNKAHSLLDVLSQQNEVLKKQIENNELKQRLKGISPQSTTDAQSNILTFNPSVEIQTSSSRLCPKCSTVNENTYSFCLKCGFDFSTTLEPKAVTYSGVNQVSAGTVKYSYGVILTFIWSTALTLITILFYAAKGKIDIDRAANNLVQGIIARPLITLKLYLVFL